MARSTAWGYHSRVFATGDREALRMHIGWLRLGALAAMLFLAGGCARHATVEKLYHDRDAGGAGYERLLVIGVASDSGQRRRFEDLLVDRLDEQDVAAVAGYTQLGASPTIMQEEVDEAARATGADAILITHVVSVSSAAELREGRVDIKSQCRGGDPADYFLYDYRELKEPDSVTFAHEVTVVTNLYDARNGERIWTIQSTCFDKADLDTVFGQEAEAIVRQLRRDRLVSPERAKPAG
jgi:hypothetical protein